MSCHYCTGGDVICRECGRDQSEYIAQLECSVDLMQKTLLRVIEMCDGVPCRQYVADFARGLVTSHFERN